MNQYWWLYFLSLAGSFLPSCTTPVPPPAVTLPPAKPATYWPRVYTAPRPLFTYAQADSVAQSLGCLTDVEALHHTEHNNWRELTTPGRFPMSTQYVPLDPGHMRGLRGQLQADSLAGYVHGGQHLGFFYATRYPVFSGPRATDSLQRALARHCETKAEIASVRKTYKYLHPDPEPFAAAAEDAYELHDDEDEQNETWWAVGAYALPLDTLVSGYYSRYYGGHRVPGYAGAGTLRFSVARQREVEVEELFRPELQRALACISAAYSLAQANYWYNYHRQQLKPPFRYLPVGGFHELGPFYSTEGLLAWQESEQGWQRLQEGVRILRASLANRSTPYGYYCGRFSDNATGHDFYFTPEGVVFCMGDDLSRWRVLLPYAKLPRYLCPVSDAAATKVKALLP